MALREKVIASVVACLVVVLGLSAAYNAVSVNRMASRQAAAATELTAASITAAMSVFGETGDMNAILSMQFPYGFHLLWSGELGPAARELSQALAAARELGNLLLQTQCLIYLTIVERRRGHLERVAELARESLEAAQSIRRVDYIGVAQANLAWLAWRMGDLEGTSRLSQAALEAWNTDSHPYPVQWLGIWPLVAVRLARGEVNEAVEPARRLLDPVQQRLPAEMAALLEQAFHSHDEADWEASRLSLSRALELAQVLDYL